MKKKSFSKFLILNNLIQGRNHGKTNTLPMNPDKLVRWIVMHLWNTQPFCVWCPVVQYICEISIEESVGVCSIECIIL